MKLILLAQPFLTKKKTTKNSYLSCSRPVTHPFILPSFTIIIIYTFKTLPLHRLSYANKYFLSPPPPPPLKGISPCLEVVKRHPLETPKYHCFLYCSDQPLAGLATIGAVTELGSDGPAAFTAVTRYSYSLPSCTFSSL